MLDVNAAVPLIGSRSLLILENVFDANLESKLMQSPRLDYLCQKHDR